jgi:hypothetical protein
MEKRRRERINRSLEELKNLILDNATTSVSTKQIFIKNDHISFYRMFVVIN